MMIEAVIWDFGGVLTTSPFDAFERFEHERGLPSGIIRRTNATNHWENAWAKFERAEVDLEAFDRLFAAEIAGPGRGGSRQGRLAAIVRRSAARNGRGAAPRGGEVQDRMHHQQPARQCDRQRRRPVALHRGGDGAVQSRDQVGQDRSPQARPADLSNDGRGTER